jgi:hypothetical protein
MCGCKGKCGCNINQTTKGEKGEPGTSGTNSFKYVIKITSSGDGDKVTIPYGQIVSCTSVPKGCYGNDTSSDAFVDYHVQIWRFNNVSSDWNLFRFNIDGGGESIDFNVDPISGDLTAVFNFAPTDPTLYRLVILA